GHRVGDRARGGVRGGWGGCDISGGDDGPGDVSALCRRGGRAGAGEHHGVWGDAAVQLRRAGRCGGGDGAVPAERIPRHEPRGGAGLCEHRARWRPERGGGSDADAHGAVRRAGLSCLRRKAGSTVFGRTIIMAKELSGAGLRGQIAGETALCTVGKTGSGLTYRGYDIAELAEKAKFEEVAFLLLRGYLPTRLELGDYIRKIKSLRALPDALKEVLERIPASAHPMDVMRTGCSMLGNLE